MSRLLKVGGRIYKASGRVFKQDPSGECCCECSCEDTSPTGSPFVFFEDVTPVCTEIDPVNFDDTGPGGISQPDDCTFDAGFSECTLCGNEGTCKDYAKELSESDCRTALRIESAECITEDSNCNYKLRVTDNGLGCFLGWCPLLTNEGVWLDPLECDCDQEACGRCVALFGPFEMEDACFGNANCDDCYKGEFYIGIVCIPQPSSSSSGS